MESTVENKNVYKNTVSQQLTQEELYYSDFEEYKHILFVLRIWSGI